MSSLESVISVKSKLLIFFLFLSYGLLSQCSSPISTLPIYDNFENSSNNWIQDTSDDFDWTLNTGPTGSSFTGPTTGDNNSMYYMYTEASFPNEDGKIANLISPCFTAGDQTYVDFSYHMYGTNDLGILNLDISNDDGVSWNNIWTRLGDQGDNWLDDRVELSGYSGDNVQIRFSVTTNTFRCDFAVDNILIESENLELCGNNIDDDGDGLIDIDDPDCSDFCAVECASPYVFDWYDGSNGFQWPITNGESSVIRTYEINGDKGLYVVTITMNNPDGQNIDLSNCGVEGDHIYTATCNDPNANFDCDGDPLVEDSQQNYDCGYLTFGITSTDSDDFVSITYDFPYPTQLCNFEIGDIDYLGTDGGLLGSWQDEIDIVADSSGVGVNIHALVGDSITVSNNTTPNINLLAKYSTSAAGNLDPNNTDSHALITTLGKITSITFSYSNGPNDDGISDDHAIRLSGFEFCPEPREICDNGIDDDGDNLVDCLDPDCAQPIISNVLVSNCIDQPLRDVVEVSVEVTWNSVPPGGKIKVIIDDQEKLIEPLISSTSSPHTVTFILPADAVSRTVNTEWDLASYCTDSEIFSTPAACSSDELTCDILYLCGLDKAYDGNAWDHGWITYLDEVNGSNSITNILTKDEPGMGTYDVLNPSTFVNLDLTEYDLIIISATTENHISTDLVNMLKDAPNSMLLSNYELIQDMGMSSDAGSIVYGEEAYTTSTTLEDIYTFNNPGSWGTPRFTNGNYSDDANAALWGTSTGQANTTDGIVFKNSASDVLIGTSITHGDRLFMGYHFNGIYANDENNGLLPVPTSSWFTPEKHLTLKGKEIFDQALVDAGVNCKVDPCGGVAIIADQSICSGESTTISASGGNTYQWSNGLGNGASHNVSPMATTTYTVTVTTEAGCSVVDSTTVDVSSSLSVQIDFNGSECLTTNSQLSAVTTGGTPNYMYSWTGPNGFTGNTETVNISIDGNYNVTVTDSQGCSGATSAFVYESYDPFIFALNTTVCEGESVTLSVSGPSATGFQWSPSAGNATSQSVTLIPTVPSSSYTVTVTNAIGCTTEATAEIMVDPKPIVSITGPTDLCIGETSQLSPSAGGQWTSTNSSVASVTNAGLVTAIANGSTTFIYKSNNTGCNSDPTGTINVGVNGTVTITGDNQICFSESPTLTASVSGGSWSSANSNIATIDANGVITPQGQGTTTIVYDITSGGCFDDGSHIITINNDPSISINGPSTICEGDNTFVNSSISGTWSSSDVSVATITSSGEITGISGGQATISLETSVGCTSSLNAPITVVSSPTISLLGPAELCIDNTTTLSPSSGGVWISSDNSVASVSNAGVVTAKDVGTATFTFIESSNGCNSDEVIAITVFGSPNINGLDDSDLCIGQTTSITPSSGGTWMSTDSSVATINNNGVITAIGAGTVRFAFTSNNTGCESDLSSPLAVNAQPLINFTGPTEICNGEQSNISPSSGGQWSSTDVTVATISSNGVITGMGPGSVTFVYTNNSTGCSSDASAPLTVNEPTEITLTGSNTICIGELSSITPSVGGSWSSSNSSIASITNSGIITGHNPGAVTFTFDSNTGCTSDPSTEVTVLANPVTSFDGPTAICIGSTTNLLPNTGGVWTSSDTNVATINNSGLVTALGFGTAQFTFIDSNTGCESTTDGALSVYNKPVPVITGSDEICIGFSTYLTPTSGGVWTSSNTNVAIISSNGQVTGVAPGTVTFTFYETGANCVSDASEPVTILQKAPVSIIGDNKICIGETTNVSPAIGGSWISDNDAVATVTNTGIVTGVSQGIAKFTFISNSGCESNETSPIIVYGPPTVSINGPDQVCIGDQLQMLPSSGGTWTSANNTIATITDQGVVTTISSGIVNFVFIDENTGCSSDPSDNLTVSPKPTTGLNGPSDICIGGTTYLTPSSGGVWTALDPSIATIQNNGQVSGISSGSARFVFTELSTGCVSEENTDISVVSGPPINFTGPTAICIGETTNITSSNPGIWESLNPSIASITNAGLITGVSSGSVKFRFTETSTGCMSDLSETLIVNGPPTVSVSGSWIVCIGSTTTLSPSTGGTWESLNPEIATTTDEGVVTGVIEGTAFFVFTDELTGCVSDGTLSINVAAEIDVQIVGASEICTGYTTTLLPNTGGVWTSSNSAIASVSNFGVVTGNAPGIVTFTFVDSSNGCSAGGTTNPITVSNCINPDFNVALVDQTITSNVNTNDNITENATYSNITQTLEKPLASLPQLVIASDGTYSFVTNKPGKYIFKVSVCLPPMEAGCPGTLLEINVLDNVYGQSNPLSNLEFYTTFANTDPSIEGNTVVIIPLANDDCVYTAGCNLDASTMSITDTPGNGTATVTGAGGIEYTPNAGFVGQDTVYYQICESVGNCSSSQQVITVNAPNALNTVVAADDFAYTLRGITKAGNVILNDSDPENDGIMITQQGSLMSPILIDEGSYYINVDGSYEFTPNESFSGALEIIYTLCDDNIDTACTDATLHIQVFDDLAIHLRVYLEGALMENNNAISIDGRPLMRDGLRVSPHTGLNYIPFIDPYSNANELYDDTPSQFLKMGPGLLPENMEISNPTTVFSVTGDNAIVDWVHVELRDKSDNTMTIATRSGLVQRDGDIVDLDGISALRFQGVNVDSFYVCVRHRTHLGVMSDKVTKGKLIDFTLASTPTFNFGTTLSNGIDYTNLSQKAIVKSGYLALWAGDFNSDGQLKFTEPASDINILYGNVLFTSPQFLINYDFTLGYFRGDYNMDGKAKYANPNDDRNFLQGQIIFHPLNVNYISNLGGVIQQVP